MKVATLVCLLVLSLAIVASLAATKPKATKGKGKKADKKDLPSAATSTKGAKKYDLTKKDDDLYLEFLSNHPEKAESVMSLADAKDVTISTFQKFTKNLEKIRKLNADNQGETEFGITELADLDDETFKATHANIQVPSHLKRSMEAVAEVEETDETEDIEGLPKSFDWRSYKKRRVISPVQNQGSCGSCWAFATAGNVEARWSLRGHSFINLSEQHLVDCSRSNNGCNGGWPGSAIDYIKAKGAKADKKYPYRGRQSRCRRVGGPSPKVGSYTMISKTPAAMMAAIKKYGPIIIIVDANDVWQHYRGGVINRGCGTEANHAVLLVGWRSIRGTPVWIVKNSWGTRWGVKGYAYVKRASGVGVCGINQWPMTAV